MSDSTTPASRRDFFLSGLHDGIPIALGYFVVSFTLGIAAKNAGLTAGEGFFASLLNNASAGEFAGFTVIAADAAYLEMVLITLVTNARYMLMSCSLSQRMAPDLSIWHRIAVGYAVTDEIFGISVTQKVFSPYYNYGAMAVALPGWALGTLFGVMAGNVLPPAITSALSVALYGMFLYIIMPPARDDRVVRGLVAASFALSLVFQLVPVLSTISLGTRTIVLTLLIAGVGAWLFPVKDEETEEVRHGA